MTLQLSRDTKKRLGIAAANRQTNMSAIAEAILTPALSRWRLQSGADDGDPAHDVGSAA